MLDDFLQKSPEKENVCFRNQINTSCFFCIPPLEDAPPMCRFAPGPCAPSPPLSLCVGREGAGFEMLRRVTRETAEGEALAAVHSNALCSQTPRAGW